MRRNRALRVVLIPALLGICFANSCTIRVPSFSDVRIDIDNDDDDFEDFLDDLFD
jgi:hypothetical protein